jgi:hypothetical protein
MVALEEAAQDCERAAQGRLDASHFRRARDLAHLIGIHDSLAQDFSLEARLAIITKLKAAIKAEIGRGKSGSWLYDINRHMTLCAALRIEYEALSAALIADQHGEGAVSPAPRDGKALPVRAKSCFKDS